ncbi:MAG: Slp family lipoprotein [Syntrophales bacterium]|jgi:outer membrane lipoprotein|nr:Slp family lipoprotein [Syntrophales bacterium]
MIRRILFVACLALLTVACASVISETTMNSVDQSISFAALQQKPDAYKGKTVVLGGQIIAVTAKDGETWIEVLEKKLDRQQKPEATDQSGGRFLVRFTGFLDPAIYAAGRNLTVAGQVEGKQVRPINEIRYTYPVLAAKEHHLWKDEETNRSPRFGIGVGGGVGSRGSGGGVGVGVGF